MSEKPEKVTFKEGVIVTAFYTVLALVAMYPYVFKGRLIAPGADAIAQYIPSAYWYQKTVHEGDSILWDPQIFSGFPSYLSQTTIGFLDPLSYLLFTVKVYWIIWWLAFMVLLIATIRKLRTYFVPPVAVVPHEGAGQPTHID